jgi:hypothetical protein
LSAHYRFYLLKADDHIARRREDYFADDTAAIAAAGRIIGDYPGIEIWCERRKVVTLSLQDVAQLPSIVPPTPHRAALLISRNKRLLQQALQACRRTEALRTRRPVGGSWARTDWQSHGDRTD